MKRKRPTPQGPVLDRLKVDEEIDNCLKRLRCGKDAEYFRSLLEAMVYQGAIPVDLLQTVPVSAQEGGKTRFDQLYDASMALAFPGYRKDTLRAFLGPMPSYGEDKVWRICLPDRFRMAHVLMRAATFQQAFALGCDYACRASMRVFGRIPEDLTIRVMFVSERALRRMMDMRWASKTHKRLQLKLIGREFTPRMVNGARLAALGHPNGPMHSIARYAEQKDLEKVRKSHGLVRRSAVESESFKKRRPIGV